MMCNNYRHGKYGFLLTIGIEEYSTRTTNGFSNNESIYYSKLPPWNKRMIEINPTTTQNENIPQNNQQTLKRLSLTRRK